MVTVKNISNTVLSFSLASAGDFIIHPGDTAEVPGDNAHIKALIGKGYLAKQAKKKVETNSKPIEK